MALFCSWSSVITFNSIVISIIGIMISKNTFIPFRTSHCGSFAQRLSMIECAFMHFLDLWIFIIIYICACIFDYHVTDKWKITIQLWICTMNSHIWFICYHAPSAIYASSGNPWWCLSHILVKSFNPHVDLGSLGRHCSSYIDKR